MAKDVIMPALGMAQDTGTLIRWLKAPGETVTKGEPLMEIETDKATVEIEAPASGTLAAVTAQPGDEIPVGQRIAVILAEGETAPGPTGSAAPESGTVQEKAPSPEPIRQEQSPAVTASPIAERMAAEHQIDLAQVKPGGGRVGKEDVLAYLAAQVEPPANSRVPASPKARRLAQERGVNLAVLHGSGPEGAVLATDVLSASNAAPAYTSTGQSASPFLDEADSGRQPSAPAGGQAPVGPETTAVSRVWRLMAERVTQAWTSIPQFYLIREVNAARLIAWRREAQERSPEKITYTDLLVKLTAAALGQHPLLNASWQDGSIALYPEANVGLAVAVEDGLVVPVIHRAGQLGLRQIAARRAELVARAQAGRLSPADLSGGTFTISNLGMYGVDAFTAIVNPPQAAILAVSRIADQVTPIDGRPAVQPLMTLSLTCDHRVVDGARGAQFLQTLAELLEDPLRLFD